MSIPRIFLQTARNTVLIRMRRAKLLSVFCLLTVLKSAVSLQIQMPALFL